VSLQHRFITLCLLAFPVAIISIKVLGPLIFVALAVVGIYISISQKQSPFGDRGLYIFSWITLGYFVVMALSIALSDEPTNSWTHLGRKLQFLIAPFVILAVSHADISMDKFLKGIKLGAIVIGLIVAIEYLLYPMDARYSGMFNPNTFGDLATMLALFTVLRVTHESRQEFGYSLIALSFGTMAVVMSDSRGAILSYIIMLLVYAVVSHLITPRSRRSWVAVAVALLSFVAVYVGTASTSDKRFSIIETQIDQWSSGEDNTNSVGVRLEMYKSGIEAWMDSPIIGYGYRNSTAVASRYADKKAQKAIAKYTHLHNEYLTNLVSAGAVGLLSLLLLLGIPMALSIKSLHDADSSSYAMMGVILIVGYATLGITHGMLEWEYENSFYLLFLAYLMPKLSSSRA